MPLAPVRRSPEPGRGVRAGGTCARLPGLGLVHLQPQRGQQEAAAPQGYDEGAAQEAVLEAEEGLQVGVGPRGPQGAGDLQRQAASTRLPAGLPACSGCPRPRWEPPLTSPVR